MDDEDITLLRLTALKSLNAKKEADLLVQTSKAVAATKRVSRSRSKSPSAVHNYLQCQDAPSRRKEYSPHRQHDTYRSDPSSPPKFAYYPSKIHPNGTIPNVQLSPRSAAFVLQNNDILARRIEGSPSPPHQPHSYRPQSPFGYGQESFSNDFRREPSPRRGHSRSPESLLRIRSPPHHHQLNWSPPAQHLSRRGGNGSSRSPPQQSSHIRRYSSRSPPSHLRSPIRPSHHHISPRYRSRSPKPTTIKPLLNDVSKKSGLTSPNARRRSPSGYKRSPDPPSNHQHHTNSSQPQRSRNAAPSFHAKHTDRSAIANTQNRRRTRSPMQFNKAKVSRSSSQSPPSRKQISSQRNSSTTHKPNHREDRSRNDRNHRQRPNNRSTQSGKRTRSPIIKEIPTLTTINIVSESSPMETEVVNTNLEPSNATTSAVVQPNTDTKTTNAIIEDTANESAESSDDDDDEHADEIDLFASEESESENEGRFKSAKPERNPQLPAVSFSALVSGTLSTTKASAIGNNLDEISTSMGISSADADRRQQRNRRDRNDRDRNHRWEGNDRQRMRAGDRPQQSNRGSGRGEDNRRRRDDAKRGDDLDRRDQGGSRRRSPIADKKHTEKEEIVVESSRSGSTSKHDSAKTSSKVSSSLSPARHTSRNRVIEEKRSERSGQSSNSGSSLKSTVSSAVSTKSAISSSARNGSPISSSLSSSREASHTAAQADLPDDASLAGSKKAIHLRLGAMTQTWKTSKKPQRSAASPEKV